MRAWLAVIAVALLGACEPQPREQQVAVGSTCLTMLRFQTDAERVAFLTTNLEQIVALASGREVTMMSAPTGLETAIIASASCDTFAANHSGLDLQEAEIARTTESTPEDAWRDVIAAFGQPRSWTEVDSHQCIARLGVSGARVGGLMNAMALSGLREPTVHGDESTLFGVYNEPCSLVRPFMQTALEITGNTTSTMALCENASLRQCGFERAISVGPAN